MTDLPVVMTQAGLQPQAPAALRTQLTDLVGATNPGYTADLPGSLIEDIASTDVGALVLIDQSRVELVNCLTPFGANEFLLNQLGQQAGLMLGQVTNTSVAVVFSGDAGYVIPAGFVVSDGSQQYVVQDGGIVGTGGVTQPLTAVAINPGSWAVPSGTVTALVTSVPAPYTIAVANPLAGIAGQDAESWTSYRTRVLEAGRVASTGTASLLRTLLNAVPGVQGRLVAIRQNGAAWEIIVGGGDQYQVAFAIYSAGLNVATLIGSVMGVAGVTVANPGVVATTLDHGFATGAVVTIADASPTNYNGIFTITVISETTFSLGVDTSAYPAYVGGGVVTPNARNVSVSIIDYPDVYGVPFVLPPQQAVAMTVTWNTSAVDFVLGDAVAQEAQPALVAYVNAIMVGQPLNLFDMQDAFRNAVAAILPAPLITRLVFAVSINGVGVSPGSGTGIYVGDPESYFYAAANAVTIQQG